MLCPEALNFEAPKSSFQTHKINRESCVDRIHKFDFTHLVSIILPDTLKVPDRISELLTNDCEYYKISKLNLNEIVEQNFLLNFVQKGNLNLLSVDTRLDCDNCVAVKNGKLVLNLNKQSFQTLGLDGKVSYFHTKTKDRYTISLDLTDSSFTPGKSNYERAKNCLKKLQLNVILIWQPHSEGICPSSIAKYFSTLNYETKLCKPSLNLHTMYSVKVPFFDFQNSDKGTCEDFAEWLGMVALEGDTETGRPEDYLTTYETPEPNTLLGQVKFLQWRGFYSTDKVEKMFKELVEYQNQAEKLWISIYVQGFSDAPIAWDTKENHFYTNSDNGYIIVFNKNNLCFITQECSRKQYK